MKSAKQNLQVIDISSEVRGRKEADIPPKTSAGLKIHAPGKGNLLSDPPGPSQTENQEIGIKVGKAQLINKLNFVNFQDGTILINLKHGQYDKEISLKATPQPCNSDLVECLWVDDKNIS